MQRVGKEITGLARESFGHWNHLDFLALKKSAGVPTDVTEDVIRAIALPLGFVDVKVCAIDETWSGLKLMVRRENRKDAVR